MKDETKQTMDRRRKTVLGITFINRKLSRNIEILNYFLVILFSSIVLSQINEYRPLQGYFLQSTTKWMDRTSLVLFIGAIGRDLSIGIFHIRKRLDFFSKFSMFFFWRFWKEIVEHFAIEYFRSIFKKIFKIYKFLIVPNTIIISNTKTKSSKW